MQIKLGDFLREICIKTVVNNEYPVLTSSKNGIYLQSEYFNKQVASKDNTGYKIIKKGQFTYRAMSDTGEFYPNMLKCVDIGIVSPAYPVFEITNRDIIYPQYLQYFFRSNTFRYNISGLEQGSTRTSIKFNKMKNIKIKLPPLLEQKKVIMILDRVGSLIFKRQEQLKYFDELTKSLFIEMFGDPVENPMNWDVKELGDYITVLTDFNSNGSYELLDSNVVMKDEPDYAWIVRITDLETMNEKGRKYIDEKTWNLLEKSKICGNEIIMCKIGSAGKIYIMPNTGKPASLGRNAFMFRFNELLEREYVYYLLNTDYGIKEITQYVRGAVTKTITKDDVRRLRVMVPPINEQKKFISFINKIDKSKLAVKKSLEELEILKKSLMQKYFA